MCIIHKRSFFSHPTSRMKIYGLCTNKQILAIEVIHAMIRCNLTEYRYVQTYSLAIEHARALLRSIARAPPNRSRMSLYCSKVGMRLCSLVPRPSRRKEGLVSTAFFCFFFWILTSKIIIAQVTGTKIMS